MSYRFLQTDDGNNQSVTTDSNGVTVYSWDATEVINSLPYYVESFSTFQIESVATTGAGNVKVQISFDGTNWEDAEDNIGVVSYSTATVISEHVTMPFKGLIRFVHDGNNTTGTIKIRAFE